MAKFLTKPSNDFDVALEGKGKHRSMECSEVIANDTGKKDDQGNPIFTFGRVYREKVEPIVNHVKVKKGAARMNIEPATKVNGKKYSFEKAPRSGSKLEKAVQLVSSTGKDDKPACLDVIVREMNVTKGNASIYFAKAKAIIEGGLVA